MSAAAPASRKAGHVPVVWMKTFTSVAAMPTPAPNAA